MPSRRHNSAIGCSPRRPSSTTRIFSSAEYCLRVARRMSFTTRSEDNFSVSTRYFSLTGADVGHIKSTRPVSGISISLPRRQSYHGPFRCIDLDMRGYGQSERPSQRYDMEVWADDVAALMEHLELHSAHIHGTSMGGMVARQFAAKYPDRTQPYHRERR